jgi:prolyl-tRNA editing enzyme YbaK/EbsC (Cys-tRNA(Pro) deacylase)
MTVPAHPRVAAVAALLAETGATGEVRVLPSEVRTAAAAARELGVPVGAIVNSLVFAAGAEPLLILTSGAHRVEESQVAALLGVEHVTPATPDFVRRHTGQVIGGVAPVGHPKQVRTIVDSALERYDQIWAAGGIPQAVFPVTYAELVRITSGSPADVA